MKNSRGWGRISKRGRNWRARITDGHGHELHRTFPTRDDAEKWLRARRDEKITGRVQRDAVARVDQLVERYRVALDESTLSAATRTWQRRCLRDIEAMLGAYQLAGLTPGHLDDFNRELRRQSFAPGSIRLRFATLRALLRFAVRHGYIEKAPDVPVQPQLSRTPPAAKPDEIEAMLKAARKHDDPRVELALALAAFAGLRRSDILRLCGRDADLDLGVLTVPVRSETDAPKGRKTIRVPIAPNHDHHRPAVPDGSHHRAAGTLARATPGVDHSPARRRRPGPRRAVGRRPFGHPHDARLLARRPARIAEATRRARSDSGRAGQETRKSLIPRHSARYGK